MCVCVCIHVHIYVEIYSFKELAHMIGRGCRAGQQAGNAGKVDVVA